MGGAAVPQAGVLAEGGLPGPQQAAGLADRVVLGEAGQRHHADGCAGSPVRIRASHRDGVV